MPSQGRARDFALLFVLSSIWGGSYMLIKVALDTVPPVTVAAGRILLAALVLAVVVRVRGERLPAGPRAWAPFVVIAVFGNVLPFSLINWGELRIDSGLAAILTGFMPLATVLLAHVFIHDERFTAAKGWGLAAGLVGLVVLVGPDALAGLGSDVLAQLSVVGAAVCYAITTVYARRLRPRSPMETATASLIVAAVLIVPAALVIETPWTLAPSVVALGAIAVLGIVGTAAASLLVYHLIATTGATFTAQINYLIPMMGVAWGVAVLGERPSAGALFALVLILSGIGLSGRRPSPAPD